MAPIVANSSNSVGEALPADKISKNKRKYLADPPLKVPDNSPPLPDDCNMSTSLGHENSDPLKHGLSLPNDDWVNWSLLTTRELEKLVISSLLTMFETAIKKIVDFGYNKEIVVKAVLRSCSYYGSQDMVSNIVENTLLFMRNTHQIDSVKESYFEDLESMARHVLSQLVHSFLGLKPSLSVGDSYWLLLLGDMTVNGPPSLVYSSLSETPGCKSDYLGSSTLTECFQTSNFVNPERETIGLISLTDDINPEKATPVLCQNPPHLKKSYQNYSPKTATITITETPLAQESEIQKDTQTDPAEILPSAIPLSATEPDPEILHSPPSEKDIVLMLLSSRERALREKQEKWELWAKEKVMEAAKRLGKDKDELKELREEREEAEKVRREKKAFEENTMRKLYEMDNHLRKTGAQMGCANGEVKRLEEENVWLRREMEKAREGAREAAERWREGVRREKEGAVRVGKWEKEKWVFQEELVAEKRRGERLDKEVELAKDRRDQQEARLKQEQNAKEELLKKASLIKGERQELEASTRQEERTIKANAEANLQKLKGDIDKLEKEISDLRLEHDAAKIAALRRGVEKLSPEEAHIRDLSRHVLADLDDTAGLKRDRECAMCLSEERAIVFLPCAHQVLCKDCNEIHEKQGMKDCPSCRTVIQQRICVRHARE